MLAIYLVRAVLGFGPGWRGGRDSLGDENPALRILCERWQPVGRFVECSPGLQQGLRLRVHS